MAYERTNWQNGDVISSEKLNKMEAGIEYACSLEHEVEDPTDGQVLKYDAEKGKFVNGDAAIETNIQNPTDGQTLKYDAASGKWVNGEGGSGSSALVVIEENGVLDKTWKEIKNAALSGAQVVLANSADQWLFLRIISIQEYGYSLLFNNEEYIADTEDGYPVADD